MIIKTLGHYQITYQLGRNIAIKVLPESAREAPHQINLGLSRFEKLKQHMPLK